MEDGRCTSCREDPYYRENEYITREMFWSDFVFSRTFSVDADLLNEETVELVCEGLDTLTEIKINGKSVAKTSDMHRTYRFPVKKYLKQGENTIEICFFSVLKYIKNYEFRENREIHYVPCGAMEGNELVRKAHSMFGWDWGPQLVDAGIFRDIYRGCTYLSGTSDGWQCEGAHRDSFGRCRWKCPGYLAGGYGCDIAGIWRWC